MKKLILGWIILIIGGSVGLLGLYCFIGCLIFIVKDQIGMIFMFTFSLFLICMGVSLFLGASQKMLKWQWIVNLNN